MNLRRPVMPLVVDGSLPVPMVCPGCDPSATLQRFAGGQAPRRDAPPGRPRLEPEREAKAQGKIKGRGTWARRKPCLHGGRGSTYQEWQRAALGAKPALALRMARASFAGFRCAWPGSVP